MAYFYLAVDGGGSSSEFLLADAELTPLTRFFTGSTSFKSVGEAAARANIERGVARLREELAVRDIELEDVYGTWGMSGCDSEADAAAYRDSIASCGLDLAQHHVCNDALLALRTVVQGAGVVVVAGTGSVAFGVDGLGNTHRIGGWGYQTSDLGSGYWIGAALLREALLFADGCREHDLAFDQVFHKLTKRNAEEGDATLGEAAASDSSPASDSAFTHSSARNVTADSADPNAPCLLAASSVRSTMIGEAAARLVRANDIAAFARIALEHEGSPACEAICTQAARYLARYAASMTRTLASCGCECAPVVLSGGLFASECFRNLVVAEILEQAARADATPSANNIHWVSQSPAYGGILMAQRRAADSFA